MSLKIGYIIPEFPGQTHSFFWREMQALEQLGASVELVSTRRPQARLDVHDWSTAAKRRTTYLAPPSAIFGTIVSLLFSPASVRQGLRLIDASEGQRTRLIALALLGAKLAYIAKARGWDHLHAHSCANSANIALFASAISGVPFSLTLHGPLDDYGQNQKLKWSRAAFGIVITEQLRKEVEGRLAGFLPQIAVAPMGVDLMQFTRDVEYTPWGNDEPLRIFSCSRLNPVKGHADLVHAMKTLRNNGIDARLEIAGEDEQSGTGYRQELQALIAQMQLDAFVTLLGAVSEATIKNRLNRAHIFVLASHHEPLGVAIMEAMAFELPVVVGDSVGVRELIDDGCDGILVEAKEPQKLAINIEWIALNPDVAVRLGHAARNKIVAQFQSTRSAKLMLDLISTRKRDHEAN